VRGNKQATGPNHRQTASFPKNILQTRKAPQTGSKKCFKRGTKTGKAQGDSFELATILEGPGTGGKYHPSATHEKKNRGWVLFFWGGETNGTELTNHTSFEQRATTKNTPKARSKRVITKEKVATRLGGNTEGGTWGRGNKTATPRKWGKGG